MPSLIANNSRLEMDLFWPSSTSREHDVDFCQMAVQVRECQFDFDQSDAFPNHWEIFIDSIFY